MMETWTQLEPLWRMGSVILTILVVATIVVAILRAVKPQWPLGEVIARLKSWWVMATVFFAVVAIQQGVSIVFFGLLSFWALKEFLTLLRTRPDDHAALALAFLAIPVQYWWIWTGWYGMFIIFVPVYVFLLIPARLVMAETAEGFVRSVSEIQWGVMAFVFGVGHLAFLLKLGPVSGTEGIDGRTLLLFLVFVVQMNDVLQFCWGKSLGRHKVIPKMSPNKTWEGLIGGVSTSVVLSLSIRFLTPFPWWECVLVAGMVATLGFFGDVVLSAVKRDFGVKDFSASLPGHGGVLDRIDSLCYAGPIFFHYVRYFHYG